MKKGMIYQLYSLLFWWLLQNSWSRWWIAHILNIWREWYNSEKDYLASKFINLITLKWF